MRSGTIFKWIAVSRILPPGVTRGIIVYKNRIQRIVKLRAEVLFFLIGQAVAIAVIRRQGGNHRVAARIAINFPFIRQTVAIGIRTIRVCNEKVGCAVGGNFKEIGQAIAIAIGIARIC